MGKTANMDVSVSSGPLRLTLSGLNGTTPGSARADLEKLLQGLLEVEIESELLRLRVLDYEPVLRTA